MTPEEFEARLDPELAAVLADVPLLDLTDVTRARAERQELAAVARRRWTPPAGVDVQDHVVARASDPPLRIRVYTAHERTSAGVVLWLHGGGHVIGDVQQDDPLMHALVAGTGCVAVSVDWRRAPEHPFPAAVEDGYAALAWLTARADRLDIDPHRVVVGGASSGGGLAAGLALMVRDRGELSLHRQILIYPMLDDRQLTRSSQEVTHPRVWNSASNDLAWRHYLGPGAGRDVSPYAAAARATDLSALPPSWLATAELDLFVDEDVDYARRLDGAGVSTDLHVYAGAMHGFDLFAPDAAVSRRFVRDRDEAFARALAT